ncbi:hypothetical protein, partial [Stenotrophomonas sp. 3diitr2024]|uniref:hypothetical protein n=1 Tax=Stenotrophomonas sp. 3diitr2024 TaxID=3345115 RepID=UPI0035CA2EB5
AVAKHFKAGAEVALGKARELLAALPEWTAESVGVALHDAPRYAGEPDSPHAISLQMITTCVSHNEPRRHPAEKKYRRERAGRSCWAASSGCPHSPGHQGGRQG